MKIKMYYKNNIFPEDKKLDEIDLVINKNGLRWFRVWLGDKLVHH